MMLDLGSQMGLNPLRNTQDDMVFKNEDISLHILVYLEKINSL
jgi:hypothetical protein